MVMSTVNHVSANRKFHFLRNPSYLAYQLWLILIIKDNAPKNLVPESGWSKRYRATSQPWGSLWICCSLSCIAGILFLIACVGWFSWYTNYYARIRQFSCFANDKSRSSRSSPTQPLETVPGRWGYGSEQDAPLPHPHPYCFLLLLLLMMKQTSRRREKQRDWRSLKKKQREREKKRRRTISGRSRIDSANDIGEGGVSCGLRLTNLA